MSEKYSTEKLVNALIGTPFCLTDTVYAIIAKFRAGDKLMKFIIDLPVMLTETGTEFPAPWNQVTEVWREEFKSWCGEYKQQSWDKMWEKGWQNYQFEFLRFIVEKAIAEYENPKLLEPNLGPIPTVVEFKAKSIGNIAVENIEAIPNMPGIVKKPYQKKKVTR